MVKVDPKYFDYAATSPPFREALAKHIEISELYFANPSSIHRLGSGSRDKLAELKVRFSKHLGFSEGKLLLCSSGTEANNTIIEGHARRFPKGRILIAANVHDSIWYATSIYKSRIDILPVSDQDQVSSEMFLRSLKPETTLVCLNHACGETGAIQPMHEIPIICSERNIRLMIDGVQTVGHIPLNLDSIPFDYYVFSSHKFSAVRGTGGILLRNTEFEPLLRGGRQEYQLRAGTENPGGLAAACEALESNMSLLETEPKRLKNLSSTLINKLKEKKPEMIINNHHDCLPGFISVSFPGYSGSEIVTALSLSGFSISTGSACHAGQAEASRIILAMGRNRKEATGTIRITMGRGTTEAAVIELAEVLTEFLNS